MRLFFPFAGEYVKPGERPGWKISQSITPQNVRNVFHRLRREGGKLLRPGTKPEKKETLKVIFLNGLLLEPGLDWRHRAVPGNSRWYQPEKRRGAIPDPGGFVAASLSVFYRGKRVHVVAAAFGWCFPALRISRRAC